MSSIKDEENTSQSEATILRQKQIATLNADTMNVPKKAQFSFHLVTFIIGVLQILVAFLIYSMIFQDQEATFTSRDLVTSRLKTFKIEHSTVNIVIAAVVYIILAVASYYGTDFQKYFENIKSVNELSNCYEKIRSSEVQLKFTIECYHHEKTNKNKSSKKVVTHTASKIINFSECYDLSGFLKPEVEKQFKMDFALIEYKASYEFLLKEEEPIIEAMYQKFIADNKRDTQQDHQKIFKFTDCQASTQQAYFMKEDNKGLNTLLMAACAVCLSWPVVLLIQLLKVERYQVKIVKKVKLDETQQGFQKISVQK